MRRLVRMKESGDRPDQQRRTDTADATNRFRFRSRSNRDRRRNGDLTHQNPKADNEDAPSAENTSGRGWREGRRAAPFTGNSSPRSPQPTEGRCTQMGVQTTTDPQSHGPLNTDNSNYAYYQPAWKSSGASLFPPPRSYRHPAEHQP